MAEYREQGHLNGAPIKGMGIPMGFPLSADEGLKSMSENLNDTLQTIGGLVRSVELALLADGTEACGERINDFNPSILCITKDSLFTAKSVEQNLKSILERL